MRVGSLLVRSDNGFVRMNSERRLRLWPLLEGGGQWPAYSSSPEEETPDLRDLRITLQLRSMRAYERSRVNTHVTLADVIYGLVERGKLGLPAPPPS